MGESENPTRPAPKSQPRTKDEEMCDCGQPALIEDKGDLLCYGHGRSRLLGRLDEVSAA